MDQSLNQLEPKQVWHYFLALSKIPRGSKHEAEAAKWVADQGRALGCEVEQDAMGNVRIRKAATPGKEKAPGVCVQAHVDMVWEKNEGTRHDFFKDPIDVYQDGDWLKARGTTLGADNGIGVAMGLALLAAKDIPHGPLEVLVTVTEETGLLGAQAIQDNWLRSKYLINIDSEDEGEVTIGSAGGLDTNATRKLTLSAPKAGTQAYRVKLSGLKGGHSGLDVHKWRAHATKILGQILVSLQKTLPFELSSLNGGNQRNAIPREAVAVLFIDPAKESVLKEVMAQEEAAWKDHFGSFDPGLTITVEKVQADKVMSADDCRNILGFLLAVPSGVEIMSPDVPGLTQTSTNLGIFKMTGAEVYVECLTRSAVETSKHALGDRVANAFSLTGFDWKHTSQYPGWKPEPNAGLLKTADTLNQKMFGKPLKVVALHAGIECGIIGFKHRGIEAISIGPDQFDVHTPDERVSIASTGRLWEYVKALLNAL